MANKYIKDLNTTTSPSLTGYTIYENGVSTSKTSLETLKDTIVDGLSHTFEGNQTINGDLIVSGSSNFGNTNDDSHNFTGSVNITGSLSLNGSQINISGSGSHLAYFDTPTSLTSSNTLHILNGGTSLGVGIDVVSSNEGEYYERLIVDGYDTHNIATFQNSFGDHYGAVNIINWNTGSHASADLVLMNSDSDESSSYVNLGINSVHHTDLSCGYAGDAYLVNFSNDLYVGSMEIAGISGHGHTHLFSGGAWRNPGISMYNDTTIGFFTEKQDNQRFSIPSSSYGYRVEFDANVKMDRNLTVDGIQKINGFTVLTNVTSSFNDDVEAAAGGVPLQGLYRSGSNIMIRLI